MKPWSPEQMEPFLSQINYAYRLQDEAREILRQVQEGYAEASGIVPLKTIVRSELARLKKEKFVVIGVTKAPPIRWVRGPDGKRYYAFAGKPVLSGAHLNDDGTISNTNYNLGTEWTVLKTPWVAKWAPGSTGCVDQPARKRPKAEK